MITIPPWFTSEDHMVFDMIYTLTQIIRRHYIAKNGKYKRLPLEFIEGWMTNRNALLPQEVCFNRMNLGYVEKELSNAPHESRRGYPPWRFLRLFAIPMDSSKPLKKMLDFNQK
jgi:hypothetical protein